MASPTSTLRIGMFGGGTVGGGVYELITKSSVWNQRISIEKICVRSKTKGRDFSAPIDLFTTDPGDILNDPGIDCVVEVMGGTDLAKTVVITALERGKSVVTANKALLAEHLEEIRQVALRTQRPLFFEAAVCGGIPIIATLQTAYAMDQITKLQGICNGTTNFMLTKMEQEGANYSQVLKEAQDLGYAEADPTADVEGHDVRAKLALLTKLAFGTTLPNLVHDCPCIGISQISAVDFDLAQQSQCTIKLLGTAQLLPQQPQQEQEQGESVLSCSVLPTWIPKHHFLANVSGSGNAVAVTSQNLGQCLYTGPGAGRFPTANSIVADVCRIATHHPKSSSSSSFFVDPFPRQTNYTMAAGDFSTIFYLRISTTNKTTTSEWVENLSREYGVSLDQCLSSGKDTIPNVMAWTTKECPFLKIKALSEALLQQKETISAVAIMPILSD